MEQMSQKIYERVVAQRGIPGRKPKDETTTCLWFDEPIPELRKGNQDYVSLDDVEYECELNWIKKGTKIKIILEPAEFGDWWEVVGIGV